MPICLVNLSICQFVNLPICQFANLSICQFVDGGECIFLVFVILLDVCTSVNIRSSYIVSVSFVYRLYRVDGYRKIC